MSSTTQAALTVIRGELHGLLAASDVDAVLSNIADALDAEGITAIRAETFLELVAAHDLYRTTLQQLAHALAIAQADEAGQL